MRPMVRFMLSRNPTSTFQGIDYVLAVAKKPG
jgi:hypothetical protein